MDSEQTQSMEPLLTVTPTEAQTDQTVLVTWNYPNGARGYYITKNDAIFATEKELCVNPGQKSYKFSGEGHDRIELRHKETDSDAIKTDHNSFRVEQVVEVKLRALKPYISITSDNILYYKGSKHLTWEAFGYEKLFLKIISRGEVIYERDNVSSVGSFNLDSLYPGYYTFHFRGTAIEAKSTSENGELYTSRTATSPEDMHSHEYSYEDGGNIHSRKISDAEKITIENLYPHTHKIYIRRTEPKVKIGIYNLDHSEFSGHMSVGQRYLIKIDAAFCDHVTLSADGSRAATFKAELGNVKDFLEFTPRRIGRFFAHAAAIGVADENGFTPKIEAHCENMVQPYQYEFIVLGGVKRFFWWGNKRYFRIGDDDNLDIHYICRGVQSLFVKYEQDGRVEQLPTVSGHVPIDTRGVFEKTRVTFITSDFNGTEQKYHVIIEQDT